MQINSTLNPLISNFAAIIISVSSSQLFLLSRWRSWTLDRRAIDWSLRPLLQINKLVCKTKKTFHAQLSICWRWWARGGGRRERKAKEKEGTSVVIGLVQSSDFHSIISRFSLHHFRLFAAATASNVQPGLKSWRKSEEMLSNHQWLTNLKDGFNLWNSLPSMLAADQKREFNFHWSSLFWCFKIKTAMWSLIMWFLNSCRGYIISMIIAKHYIN